METCRIHGKEFVHKEGVSKKTGKPYSFWSCSEKLADGSYCSEKPLQEPVATTARPSNGNGNTDLNRSYRIERQHSQDMALRDFQVKGKRDYTDAELKARIDWFVNDLDKKQEDPADMF